MQVYYCDSCLRRISEGDLADGYAVKTSTGALCLECSKSVQPRAPEPEPEPEARKTPPNLRKAASNRMRRVSPSSVRAVAWRPRRLAGAGASGAFLAVAGITLGLLSVLLPYRLFGESLQSREVPVEWSVGRSEAGTSFRGLFRKADSDGVLVLEARSAGRWTMSLNGHMVCFAQEMTRGDEISLGPAAEWLNGQANILEATFHGPSGGSPPRVSVR